MEEITKKDIYDKLIECFNKTFEETYKIRNQNSHTIDQMDPTYSNVRNIHGMVYELVEENKKLHSKINRLEDKIDLLLKK